jgi:hypothetical protein
VSTSIDADGRKRSGPFKRASTLLFRKRARRASPLPAAAQRAYAYPHRMQGPPPRRSKGCRPGSRRAVAAGTPSRWNTDVMRGTGWHPRGIGAAATHLDRHRAWYRRHRPATEATESECHFSHPPESRSSSSSRSYSWSPSSELRYDPSGPRNATSTAEADQAGRGDGRTTASDAPRRTSDVGPTGNPPRGGDSRADITNIAQRLQKLPGTRGGSESGLGEPGWPFRPARKQVLPGA